MPENYTICGVSLTEQELVGHIVASVKNIFSTMIFIDDIVDDYPLAKPVSHFTCSISGMVGLGGDLSGVAGILMHEVFAKEATASMLGMEIDELEGEGDINDAVGEITNMLAGEIKMFFNDRKLNACLSTPSIVAGKDYTVEVISSGTAVIVPFNRGEHQFIASLQVEAHR